MVLMRRVLGGFRALFRRRRVEGELDAELRAYLDAAIEERMRTGVSREEATRAARVEIGSLAAIKDHTRDVGWESIVESVWQDARYAVRVLRKSPGFATAAILTLALGIGASTTIFSAVDAVVLRALPFADADRLVLVGTPAPPTEDGLAIPAPVAHQDFFDWRDRQQVFTPLAGYSRALFTLTEPGAVPEDVRGLRVSSDLFDLLGVAPVLGRGFERENELAGRHGVAVISYGLWRGRFASASDVVGRGIRLDGESYDIVGVAPPDFSFPIQAGVTTQVWVPLVDERVRETSSQSVLAVGRLPDGMSLDVALAQMTQIAHAVAAEHPEWANRPMSSGRSVALVPLREAVVGERTRAWMLLLLGAVALVLLIVCANVAGLVLARATVRGREIAIRAATGASQWRIVRQLLTETLVVWAAGAALGVLLAYWGADVLRTAMPEGIARAESIALDLRVLAVAAGATVAAGILFGLFPATHCSRPNLTQVLNDGGQSASAGIGRQRMRAALVVLEVALAVVLLVGAGLFIASFAKLMQIEIGFEPRSVLIARAVLSDPVADPRGSASLERIEHRVGELPGVESVAAATGTIPLGGSYSSGTVEAPGRPGERESISITRVGPDYHRVMRIPLLAGRYLHRTDHGTGEPVVVIDELAASTLFAGADPIGQHLVVLGQSRRIVGVVGRVRHHGFESQWERGFFAPDVVPTTYIPIAQDSGPPAAIQSRLSRSLTHTVRLFVRTTGDPLTQLPAIRAAVHTVLQDEPLRSVDTLDAIVARSTAQRRLSMLLLGQFGLLGVVIAAVGVYGVMAYVVAQRTHEIGVRMALGATRAQVVGALLREAAALTTAGLAIGTAGAWALSSTARAFLFQIEPTDVRVFAAALLVLATSALVASALPAHRAATVDPVTALRQE